MSSETDNTAVESEAALLGAMIMNRQAVDIADELLVTRDSFSQARFAVVWDAIQKLAKLGEPIDELTVIQELRLAGKLDDVGGPLTIMDLVGQLPALANTRSYARIVVESSVRRKLGRIGATITDYAKSSETSGEAYSRSVEALLDGVFNTDGGEATIAEANSAYTSRYAKPESKRLIVRHPFESWNHKGRGLHESQIAVIGGYSGDGKSWLGLQYAESACIGGKRVGFFSMEMSTIELQQRLLAMRGFELDDVIEETVDIEKLGPRLQQMNGWDLTIFEGRTSATRIVKAVTHASAHLKPYDLIVIDHIHLLDVEAKHGDYRIKFNESLERIKAVANVHKCAIVCLAQLNRPSRDGKTVYPIPNMTNLRESTGLEQIADQVVFIYRERDEHNNALDHGIAFVSKQRQGRPPSRVHITLRGGGFSESHQVGERSVAQVREDENLEGIF